MARCRHTCEFAPARPLLARLALLSGLLLWQAAVSGTTGTAADDVKPAATPRGKDVSASIVRIESFDAEGVLCNRALGFVVGPRLVATNLHVARRGTSAVATYTVARSGSSAKKTVDQASVVVAGVRGFDRDRDLLLLELAASDSADKLPALPLTEAADPKPGTAVQVVPFSLEGPAEPTPATLAPSERVPGSEPLLTLAARPGSVEQPQAGGIWLAADGQVLAVAPGDYVAGPARAVAVPARHLRALLDAPPPKDGPLSFEAFQAALLTVSNRWTTLFDARTGTRKKAGGQAAPLPSLRVLHFEGPGGDPFYLGRFRNEGQWGLQNGVLQPVGGKQPAVKLATADTFELEGLLSAEGTGGWFFLFGWDGANGHLLYNVTYRVSGSPWRFAQLRDHAGIQDSTHQELAQHHWKGFQTLRLAVERTAGGQRHVSLRVGDEAIIQDLELPDYAPGDLLLGTYDTRYGPKPVKIQSLRIRAR